jgi:hypothetical protein
MNPGLLFRNAQLVEQGWQLQREEGQDFEAFFGAREVLVPADELNTKIAAWTRYRHDRVVERVAAGGLLEAALTDLGGPGFFDDLPDDMVGVLHSDAWGMSILGSFGKFEALFRDPSLVESEEHMDVLDDYVQDEAISPLPFEVVCGRYPDGASKVFAAYLEEPEFEWARDGAELMRDIKKENYDLGPMPNTRPMSNQLLEGLKRARARAQAVASGDD